MCFYFLYSFRLKHFLVLRRIHRDIINVHRYTCKYPLFLSYFHETWILTTGFRKILKYQMLRKYVHWGPSWSMRKYRRTDMTKLIVAFRNFTNASKNVSQLKMTESTYFEIYWGEEERLPSMSSELRGLTFIGPCSVIYFYRKTNQMHQFLNLFYFGICQLLYIQSWNSWRWTERPSETCRIILK